MTATCIRDKGIRFTPSTRGLEVPGFTLTTTTGFRSSYRELGALVASYTVLVAKGETPTIRINTREGLRLLRSTPHLRIEGLINHALSTYVDQGVNLEGIAFRVYQGILDSTYKVHIP